MCIVSICVLKIPALPLFLSLSWVGVSESVRINAHGGMDRICRVMGSRAIRLITYIVIF